MFRVQPSLWGLQYTSHDKGKSVGVMFQMKCKSLQIVVLPGLLYHSFGIRAWYTSTNFSDLGLEAKGNRRRASNIERVVQPARI